MQQITQLAEMRFNLGHGYLKLRIPSRTDAMKILVLLRELNTGLYYDARANNIILCPTSQYSKISKILIREGFCRPPPTTTGGLSLTSIAPLARP